MTQDGGGLWRRLRGVITGEPDDDRQERPAHPPMFTASRPPTHVAHMGDRLFPAPADTEAVPPPQPEPAPPPQPAPEPAPPPDPAPAAEFDTLEIPRVEPYEPPPDRADSELRRLADELERYSESDTDALSQLIDAPPPEPSAPTGGPGTIAVYPERVDEPPPRSAKVPAPPVRVHDEALDRRAAPQELTPSEALALAQRGPGALGPREDVNPAS